MTDAELSRIESELELTLPSFYREFMLDYPKWLLDKQPEGWDIAKCEFANEPDRIIYFNQYVRGCEPDEFFDDQTWPPHYFVIGSEAEQNWYFLDLGSGSEAVYLYHHETGEVGEEAKTLNDFPESLVRWWRDIESAG